MEMRVDCHMHTYLCGHAVGEPEEYVRTAAQRGIQLMTFTCHVPMKDAGFGQQGTRMRHDQLPEYFALVERARREGESLGVEVLCGIEAEIYPEADKLTDMDETLAAHEFDFILGSLHHQCPGYQKWLQRHRMVTDHEKLEAYFAHVTLGVMSGRYHSLAHPDVIRIYGTVERFHPPTHEETLRRLLQACVDHEVCLEVNTSGLDKGVYTLHPDPIILDWAAEMGVRLTLGSDSHRPENVGRHFDNTLAVLRKKGFAEIQAFRKGQRFGVGIG